MKKIFILLIVFLCIDATVYWNLWQTYFQQDEWLGFGQSIYQIKHIGDIFRISGIHFFPLGQFLWMLVFYSFRFNPSYYAFTSLFLHALTTVLVFFLFKFFTKRPAISFLLAFLFSISFPSRQVVIWFAVLTSLVPVAIVIFIFFIVLFLILKRKVFGLKENIILGSIFFIGTLLKEDIYILLPLLPTFIFLFASEKTKQILKSLSPVFIFMLLVVLIRFLYGFTGAPNVNFQQPANHKAMIIYNIESTPVKMTVQNVIDSEDLWNIDSLYTRYTYPWLASDGTTVTTTIFDEIVLLLSLPILLLIGYAFGKLPRYEKKLLIFSLVWLLSCALVISPQTRYLYALESRYLFIASFGFFLLMYTLFYSLLLSKNIYSKRIFGVFTVVSTVIFIIYSCLSIQNRLQSYYIPVAQQRISIINQLEKIYPSIGTNTVFYATCSTSTCNHLILPFQSGVGQMLLVLYGSKNPTDYRAFMSGFFLWDWEAEGYKNINGYGFGYYRTFSKVETLIYDKKISPSDIKSFSYNPKTNTVTDISASISATLERKVYLK